MLVWLLPCLQERVFPFDKQLALLPGRLTPLLQDQLAHLGAWMPFAQAAALLASFTHNWMSESTNQRQTEAVGGVYEAVQHAEVERIERPWPEVAPGPAKLAVSDAGRMVSHRFSFLTLSAAPAWVAVTVLRGLLACVADSAYHLPYKYTVRRM